MNGAGGCERQHDGRFATTGITGQPGTRPYRAAAGPVRPRLPGSFRRSQTRKLSCMLWSPS